MFLLYINDLPNALPDKIRLFADDSNIFIIDNTINGLFLKANSALDSINKWLIANQLTLNIENTNYRIFKPNEFTNNYILENNLTLQINNKIINRTSNARYLGVLISEKLTWDEYIREIVNNIKSYSGIIYKYRKNLTKTTAKNIYFSYIFSELSYGLELYGTSPKYVLNPLEIACNRILRYLQNQPRLYPTHLLYKNYNTLPIYL